MILRPYSGQSPNGLQITEARMKRTQPATHPCGEQEQGGRTQHGALPRTRWTVPPEAGLSLVLCRAWPPSFAFPPWAPSPGGTAEATTPPGSSQPSVSLGSQGCWPATRGSSGSLRASGSRSAGGARSPPWKATPPLLSEPLGLRLKQGLALYPTRARPAPPPPRWPHSPAPLSLGRHVPAEDMVLHEPEVARGHPLAPGLQPQRDVLAVHAAFGHQGPRPPLSSTAHQLRPEAPSPRSYSFFLEPSFHKAPPCWASPQLPQLPKKMASVARCSEKDVALAVTIRALPLTFSFQHSCSNGPKGETLMLFSNISFRNTLLTRSY